MRLEDWQDIRARHAAGEAIKAIARAKGVSRNTVRRALAADRPPARSPRPSPGSVADAYEPAILEQLAADPTLPAAEIARRIDWPHSMTVLKDRVRALRPRGPRRDPAPHGAPPVELSTFVGRGAELAAIRQALQDKRLVSLVGPGGVGKTRLAARAAAAVGLAFGDGVCTVELAALRDGDLVGQTVLDALGLGDGESGDPLELLVRHLRHRDLLLVLDNVEHLLDAVALTVVALLGAAPRVHVLATGRQALGIAGEHVVQLDPLALPDAAPATPAEALRYPAVALFVDRAASVLPGFALDERSVGPVTELCARLDGIPLAIELAAVRLRVLSVEQLLDRVADRFAVLTVGDRTGPARHRTLQATIAWSHELCTPVEREIWSRAGVFPGSFALDALSAVCSGPEIGLDPGAVLDGVSGLAAKSILVRQEDAGEVRFQMLETIREFGHGLLPAELEDRLAARHRDHYLALTDALARDWFGPRQEAWVARVRAEQANLRTALEHALRDPGDGTTALRLVGEPWFLWGTALSLAEHRRRLHRALAAAPAPTPERIRALCACGLIDSLQGDQATAARLAKEAAAGAADLGHPPGAAFARHVEALIAYFSEDFERSATLFAEAERRHSDVGSGPDLRGALDVQVGLLDISRGRLAEAAERLEAVRARSTAAGEQWLRTYAVDALGFVALSSGDVDGARCHAREALTLAARFDDTISLSLTLDLNAWTAAAAEEHERAAVLLGAATSRWRSFGQQLYGSPDWQTRREGYELRARASLGAPAFDAGFRHGAAMNRSDMLAFALGTRARPELPGPLDVLTAREGEIAGLVAEGLTNREIAARLVLSPRTVEGHIGRILTKLGFGRRSQLAAWVARTPR